MANIPILDSTGAVRQIATLNIGGVEHQKVILFDAFGNAIPSPFPVTIAGDTVGSITDSDNVAKITQNSKYISNGAVDCVPKFAVINRATSADGAAVVNLVASKKIRVLRYHLIGAGTVGLKWQSSTSNSSGSGSNTDLTGLETYSAGTGLVEPFCLVGVFETVAGEALKLNLNAAVQVSGNLTYIEI